MSVKNGLSAIANEVLGDVQKEAEAAIIAAEKTAKEALKAAKGQADQNYQAAMTQAKVKSEAERRKVASITEVEMRNRLLEAKEALVEAAFQKAQVKLGDFASSKDYQTYLIKLIEEVARKMGQKNLRVEVNAKDKSWLTPKVMNGLSKKLDCELKLSDQGLECIGGCKIQTENGKVTIDSTIDNRLLELKPTLRVEVAKILFGREA